MRQSLNNSQYDEFEQDMIDAADNDMEQTQYAQIQVLEAWEI